MTEADLWSVIFFACLASPADLPHTPKCPPAAMAAPIRYALVAEMWEPHEGWSTEYYGFSHSVRWIRQNLGANTYPPICELERMPTADMIRCALSTNYAVSNYATERMHYDSFRREYWRGIKMQADSLRVCWECLENARTPWQHVLRRRECLAEFRDYAPYYYRLPGMLPSY